MTADAEKKPIHLVSDAQLEELRLTHPDCDRLEQNIRGRRLQVVVAPPTRAQYQRFNKTAQDEKKRQYAVENLVVDCVISPGPELFALMLEQYPAMPAPIGAWIIEAGGGVDVEAK